MSPTISFELALQKLESFCAYQERSPQEVQKKISSWNFPDKERVLLVETLESKGFLNEERYVNAYVSGKFRISKWGRWKIYAHLQQKQIGKDKAKKAVLAIPQEAYIETLTELLTRKLSAFKDQNSSKDKVFRYLIGRGFEYECVQQVWELHHSQQK
jgi:regulatory protein